jgi:hypothetical protein
MSARINAEFHQNTCFLQDSYTTLGKNSTGECEGKNILDLEMELFRLKHMVSTTHMLIIDLFGKEQLSHLY